ncbi:MAG: hypothetical protein LBG45_07915 [Dysgonamonadaceae bacterium]|nr:hypothetical protein [Dysgonamonadaceae bacterium]
MKLRVVTVRKLKHTVNKVSSLRDLAEMEPHSDRRLKPAVNKVLSLRDKPCNT